MSTEGCSSSTSVADSTEKQEIMKKASELLAQGKRNMVCGEVPKAISLFDEAVQMLAKEYGDLSKNCVDAYFNYGSALLELGRMETNVLGVALEGVDKETGEKSDKVEKESSEEKGKQENEKEKQEESNLKEKTGKENTEDQQKEEKQDSKEEKMEGVKESPDVPNFQLAWEYLDLAKVIYLKSEDKEDQLKAAECHIKLGEVSMETEQHSTAAEDLESALKIQQKYLAPEDRVIAETHYQLGLAYGLGKEFELSIQHYQKAISVIEAKIASLNKLVEENEKGSEDKEKTTDDKENSADDKEKTTDDKEKTTDDKEKTTDNKENSADDKEKTTDDKEKTTDDKEKTTDNKEKTTDDKEKTTEDKENTSDDKENTADDKEKTTDEKEKTTDDKDKSEQLKKYKDEIKELKDLIPEMISKIEDTKTEAKDMEKVKEMAKEMLGLSGTTKGFGSPTKKAEASKSENVDENGEKKASDISSLVRKKRKPEEEVSAESVAEVKKIKQDDGAALTTKTLPEETEAKVNGVEEVKVNGTPEIKANGDATDAEMAAAS
ncbi:hypothetical protein EGW08_008001 [Elysia chlorotica]|uniref:Tetratricopeptide SHNi-TPR domain-containing protein n=1 Tax=Elysia chlorotica TaxID=188477 RepID=A0A433TRK2_ELYCH|nr:hypothetical protein EGW08_008001 [Elysia chlorotica]